MVDDGSDPHTAGRMSLWKAFCRQQRIREEGAPLFATDGRAVRVQPLGGRIVLERSPEMIALVGEQASKIERDFRDETHLYEGLLYMLYWTEGDEVIPLYIGKTEKYGKKHGNLSANISRSRNVFCRWGYGRGYHLGELSAAACVGGALVRSSYVRWAERLFETAPAERPVLVRETYFWISAWRRGATGP